MLIFLQLFVNYLDFSRLAMRWVGLHLAQFFYRILCYQFSLRSSRHCVLEFQMLCSVGERCLWHHWPHERFCRLYYRWPLVNFYYFFWFLLSPLLHLCLLTLESSNFSWDSWIASTATSLASFHLTYVTFRRTLHGRRRWSNLSPLVSCRSTVTPTCSHQRIILLDVYLIK